METPINEQANTLFLGDLSIHCTERDVRKLFRSFGAIETVRIKRNSNARTNLCYGFVKFSSKEAAEDAMSRMNGTMFLGRCIRIGWAAAKEAQQATPFDGHVDRIAPKQETAQIHVSFISKQVDSLISEATIRNLFAAFGEVLDVTIKKSQFDKNLNIQNGYGFVHFPVNIPGLTAAIEAVNSLHQVTIDRVTYDCSISHALEQQLIAWNIPLPHSHVPTQPPHEYYPSFVGSVVHQQPALSYPPQQQMHQSPMMGISPPLISGYLDQRYGQQSIVQQRPIRIMQHHPIMTGALGNNLYLNNSGTYIHQPSLYAHQDHIPPNYQVQHQQQQQPSYQHLVFDERVASYPSQSFGRPRFHSQYQLRRPQQYLQPQQQAKQQAEYDIADFARLSINSSSLPSMSYSDIAQSASFTSAELLLASVSSSSSSFHPNTRQPMGTAATPARRALEASVEDPLEALIDQTLSTSAENQARE
jgi:RNA recognition motif-containing protein